MIKAVIVDLDGTLLRKDQSVSEFTLGTLRKCREKGIKVMVATARPRRNAKMYTDIIDFDAMTFSNGARVIYGGNMTDIDVHFDKVAQTLDALSAFENMRITLETGDNAFSNRFVGDFPTVVVDDLLAVAKTEKVLKVVAHIPDDPDVVKIKLPEGLHFTVSGGYYMQIMNRTATKWNGVCAMLDYFGISPEEAAYFGDDFDDIEPIKHCGVGVTSANAIDEVKAVADHITVSNDEDGVANYIVKNILI